MAVYPADWDFDVVLKDGGVARLRPIRPDDADTLHALFRRLSSDSVYQRFFRYKKDLTPEELEFFTRVDYERRMAFVAEIGENIVAVGRYDGLDEEPSTAEVAFAVEDAHQGRGIGTQLLQHLTGYARTHGIEAFRAFVLPDNYPMMRVFRNSGYRLRRELGEGVYTVDFPTELSAEAHQVELQNEQRAVAASILPIFYPRSVAVIGASRDEASIGGRLLQNLLDSRFAGAVFPVNPNSPVVGSVRAYPSVLDIPDPVDLAMIVVPADVVLPVVKECAEKGVRGLCVISAGFSETGEEGARLEGELLEAVRMAGMRMVGPNCMGLVNTDPAVRLNATFAPLFPPRGNVAMSSQSGALGIAILDYARRLDIGISTFVSVGNKADISGNDLLLYWGEDPSTDVILLYLESFGHPRRFARIARDVGRRKPIAAVKSGRTTAGARAASSHTGALASVDVAVSALFRQAGVIRTDTLEELFEVTALLANQPLPEGRRVAVLTNAGGPGILTVDALEAQGLTIPELSPELRGRLRTKLASEASVGNPVDMIASAGPQQYRDCLEVLLDSDEVDAVIVIFIPTTPAGVHEVAASLRDATAGRRDKTLLAVFMQSGGTPVELSVGEVRIPSYRFPEAAARALARAVEYAEWRRRPEGRVVEFADVDSESAARVIRTALDRLGDEGGWLEPGEVEALLGAYGIRLVAGRVAGDPDEAVDIARQIGRPVVVKVVSPTTVHKSDIGGVALDLRGDDDVRAAYERVTSVVEDSQGALVQEFVPDGHEVIIGMTEDPSFGPLIAFGLGGLFVELVGDIAFRIHPLTDIDAAEMVGGVRTAPLLEGYRGGPPGDVAALEEALLRISALVEALPEVVELDLNPVKVLPPGDGVRVVDARARVRAVKGQWVPSRVDLPAVARLR
ncbi:MAG: GNAT family N-acetyltransferase [Acidimicrobiia bacterium]